jgi:hypothetical protein
MHEAAKVGFFFKVKKREAALNLLMKDKFLVIIRIQPPKETKNKILFFNYYITFAPSTQLFPAVRSILFCAFWKNQLRAQVST